MSGKPDGDEVKVPRWYHGGEVRFMALKDNWVMARKPGCIPFTIYAWDWLALPTAEFGRDMAEAYRKATERINSGAQ